MYILVIHLYWIYVFIFYMYNCYTYYLSMVEILYNLCIIDRTLTRKPERNRNISERKTRKRKTKGHKNPNLKPDALVRRLQWPVQYQLPNSWELWTHLICWLLAHSDWQFLVKKYEYKYTLQIHTLCDCIENF